MDWVDEYGVGLDGTDESYQNSVVESERSSVPQYRDSQGYVDNRNNHIVSPVDSQPEQPHQSTSPHPDSRVGQYRSEKSPSPQDVEQNTKTEPVNNRTQELHEGMHRMRFQRTGVSIIPAQPQQPQQPQEAEGDGPTEGRSRTEKSPSPPQQNTEEPPKSPTQPEPVNDRTQEPWYQDLHRMRFKRTGVSIIPAQKPQETEDVQSKTDKTPSPQQNQIPNPEQMQAIEAAPLSEEETTRSDLKSAASSRSSKSQRSSVSDVTLPGHRSYAQESGHAMSYDRMSAKSNKTASSRRSSGGSSSGQASLIERINRAESSHLIGEFGRTGSSVGSLKDEFSKPSSGRGIKGLDSTLVSETDSGQVTVRSEATTSIQEPLRNPVLDPLRSGSDVGMAFQRYGSMQSIPEHEPPAQSEGMSSERDPLYKTDLDSVQANHSRSCTTATTVTPGLTTSLQDSQEPVYSETASLFDQIPNDCMDIMALYSSTNKSGGFPTHPSFRSDMVGEITLPSHTLRKPLESNIQEESMVSESYMSDGFGLVPVANRGRRGRHNQDSQYTGGDEGGAYRHASASMNSHASSDFITAVEKGDSSFVKKALDNPNLDPEKKTRFQQRTALHLAAGYGQSSVAEELLYAGVEPSTKAENGRTPLHEAAQGGHEKVLQLLLDYTRDVEVKDRDGRTACHLAAYHGEVKCVEILMDKGAQLVVKDNANRQPAHLAAMRNHRNILEYLYDKGVDLSCEDNSGKLPVHYAAQFGALDCLICLVERECDITLPDSSGNLPIHFAAWNDHLDCIRFLVKQGTSLEVTQGENRTPVHVAALHGSYKVLHWLCEKGCNIESQDKFLNTPLHLAGEAGKPKCFNCLLQHDASLSVINRHNATPLESAKKMGHKLAMERAMSNSLPCPLCRQQFEYEEWEEQTAPPPVVRTVSRMATVAFSSPLPKPQEKTLSPIEISAEKRKKKLLKKRKQSPTKGTDRGGSGTSKSIFSFQKEAENTKKRLPKRDLPTKYFGEYLTTVGELYKLKI